MILKKAELAKKFFAFFCELIYAGYEFSPYLACIYSLVLILRNQPNFGNLRKYVHAKISTLKVDKNRRLHFKLPSLHFKSLVFHTAFAIYFVGYFPDPKF